LISYEEAFELVLSNVPTMGTARVVLSELTNRVLAEPIHSPIDLPIFTNSAVDGYAVRSADAKSATTLKVVGYVPAGTAPFMAPAAGEAVRVFTGSPLPQNADAVVMQEYVEVVGDQISILDSVEQKAFVRERGEELRCGDLLLSPNTLVTPATLATLATVGVSEVEVYKRPRVAVIGTGTELVPAGSELQPGQIFESNTHGISAAARLAGGNVGFVAHAKDDPIEIGEALRVALKDHDLVITCGGVSVGDHDYVREACGKLGVNEVFWRVAMRPGRPLYFGVGGEGQLVFGLPGNPVSALVTFLLFVRPALLAMVGLDGRTQFVSAKLGERISKAKGRADFVRAKSRGGAELILDPVDGQGSHMSTGLAGADHLIFTPVETECIEAGEAVRATRIQWGLC